MDRAARAATSVRRSHRVRWHDVSLGLALLAPVAFIISTVPGVRAHRGYSFLLDGVLNNLAYEAAALLCLLRVRRLPGDRAAGYLLAAGLAVYGSGNVFWTAVVRPMAVEPFPSGADALFLCFYPLTFLALVLVLRHRAVRMSVSLWLDGLVGGLAAAAVAAAVVIGPIVHATSGSWAAVATTTAYPVLDLVLLLVLATTLSLFRWRPPIGLWLLTAGLLLFVVADVAYLFQTAEGTYSSGGMTDGAWVLAVVLVAAAPGWADRPAGLRLPTWALLAIPLVSALAALALLVVDHVVALHPAAVGLAAATVVTALLRLVVTFREVTALADSHQLALTDELTGLGNRRALYERAPQLLGPLDASASVALLILDLDRFKEVNDTLGHSAGDAMLREVATRLASFVPDGADLVVRLGGDEFAFLVAGSGDRRGRDLAAQVGRVLRQPMDVGGVAVRADGSIGIAVLPAAEADLTSLLRQADVAMYHAKSHRLGSFAYEADLDEFASGDRLETVELLRATISARQLVMHYQPKVDGPTRRTTGVEALVRWEHPARGLLLPGAFLGIAEDAGLMEGLTAAVLDQVLDQTAAWHRAGRPLTVAVNLSASSLSDEALPDRVAAQLADRGLPPSALEVEITEDFLVRDRAGAQLILAGLRERGVRVAVDDYGTGYSSLAYLRELPVDDLKLDRSFLTDITTDPRALAIVQSTIRLAHSLGMRLVAEGVEDAETSLQLDEAGCDVQQGWYYARAMPAGELEQWLDRIPAPAAGPAELAAAPAERAGDGPAA